ncbi:MAG TPA: hypothetical protein DDZ51_29035 [Planctomycetaceae bacterium]|nr:hypothetical protein [Planctomycetaceae bacterium]
MSDVRCPSCGDSFRVPDFAVPAGAMAKCPWCGDTFSMSMLVVHLPPLADLIGEDGEPISLADLALTAAPMALAAVGADSRSALGSAGITSQSSLDADPAMLGSADLGDSDFDEDDFDDDFDSQRLGSSELANDVSEFAEEGVTFADAGLPEPTSESTEWHLDSPQPTDSDGDRSLDPESNDEFDDQGGSPPRPLAEVTDFGLGREDRPLVSRPRTKRKGSPIKSILGVMIGGLMAFPLAAGILALVGKPLDLGFWPFDGQAISMNAISQRGAAPPRELSPRAANNGNDANNANRRGRSLADDISTSDVDPPSLANSPGDASTNSLTTGQSAADDIDNLLATPSPAVELAEIPTPSSIKLPPMTLPTTAPVAEVAEPAEVAAPENFGNVVEASSKLQSALEEASVAMGDIVDYDDAEGVKGRRARLATLFAKVAAVASTASLDDEAAVGSLVERLVDTDLIKDLAPAAPNWARFSSRPSNGMLAVGKLVRENDQWQLRWNNPVPLELRFADPAIAEEDADVIILGTIQQTDPSTVVEVKYMQKQ